MVSQSAAETFSFSLPSEEEIVSAVPLYSLTGMNEELEETESDFSERLQLKSRRVNVSSSTFSCSDDLCLTSNIVLKAEPTSISVLPPSTSRADEASLIS